MCARAETFDKRSIKNPLMMRFIVCYDICIYFKPNRTKNMEINRSYNQLPVNFSMSEITVIKKSIQSWNLQSRVEIFVVLIILGGVFAAPVFLVYSLG